MRNSPRKFTPTWARIGCRMHTTATAKKNPRSLALGQRRAMAGNGGGLGVMAQRLGLKISPLNARTKRPWGALPGAGVARRLDLQPRRLEVDQPALRRNSRFPFRAQWSCVVRKPNHKNKKGLNLLPTDGGYTRYNLYPEFIGIAAL